MSELVVLDDDEKKKKDLNFNNPIMNGGLPKQSTYDLEQSMDSTQGTKSQDMKDGEAKATTDNLFLNFSSRAVDMNAGEKSLPQRIWFYTFHPDERFRKIWDLIMILLVCFSSLWEPYKAAYLPGDAGSAIVYLDTFYVLDIILTFKTAYYDSGYQLVHNLGLIARQYLSFWFWIDVVATAPWDIIVTAFVDDFPENVLRLVGMIRVFRLAKAARIIKRLTSDWVIHTTYIEAMKFFLYSIVVAHVLGCLFWIWPLLFYSAGSCTPIGGGFTDVQEEYRVTKLCEDAEYTGPHLTYYRGIVKEDPGCLCVLGACSVPCDMTDAGAPHPDYSQYGICVCDDIEIGECAHGPSQQFLALHPGGADLDGSTCFEKHADHFQAACISRAECAYTQKETWRVVFELEHLTHFHQYTSTLYWALTTMTTIGYGDITPQLPAEIAYVMAAMLIGVSFFALLVTQINELNEVVGGEGANYEESKNNLVSYMNDHNVDKPLIRKIVSFINFKSSSHSAHSFNEADKRLDILSGPLRKELRISMFQPIVEKLKMFGWNQSRITLKELKALFDEIDSDGGGSLDREELKELVINLGESATDDEIDKLMIEMDTSNNEVIEFPEFENWWKRKEAKIAGLPRAPEEFMRCLACLLHTIATAPGDKIFERGEYGRSLYIVCTGVCQVVERVTVDGKDMEPTLIRRVTGEDPEPVFGSSALLDNADYMTIHSKSNKRFGRWEVSSESYCNLACISRADLRAAIENFWPQGKTLRLPCVSTAFAAKTLPSGLCLHCLRG